MVASATLSAHSRPDERARGVLPLDAWYEILLCLPSKDLCRLRAVCRPWRSLLSGQHFIAAHAARHPEPLIVAGYNTFGWHSNRILFEIIDLSGSVVKRIDGTRNEIVTSAHQDLICIINISGKNSRLLNLATGARYACPGGLAEENAAYAEECVCWRVMELGKVSSTGEYKVLRVIDRSSHDPRHPGQLYEVFTVGGNPARWRRTKAPPVPLKVCGAFKSMVIDGTVYFSLIPGFQTKDFEPDCLILFDLETEEWRPIVRGPLSSLANEDAGVSIDGIKRDDFYLASLSGSLVLVHRLRISSSMDLWFVVDTEQGLWVKQHTIQIDVRHAGYAAATCCPLLVLDDGRIVLFHTGGKGLISIHNPRTNTTTDVAEIGFCVAVSLYTGSLLTLATGSR